MTIDSYRVLGVRFDPISMQEAIERLRVYLADNGFHQVVTLGTEMVMRGQEDQDFRRLVEAASMVVPDGIGVVMAARYCGLPVPERVAGVEMLQKMVAEFEDTRFFMLGGAPGVAEEAARVLRQRHPNLQIAGIRDGYFQDDAEVVAQIKESQADVLLAGLGCPRQENWLRQYGPDCGVRIGIGVGGSFDVISGKLQRAPQWMIRLHLEWLYRLLCQPSRVLRMMSLPRFALKVLFTGKRAVEVTV